MPGIYRRENTHPNKWVNFFDKPDCYIKRRENAISGFTDNIIVRRRVNGGWVQIYPAPNVFIDGRVNGCGNKVGYKNNGSWTFDGTARQGVYGSYGQYYGFLDIGCWGFEGSGAIVDVTAGTFSATRNGSGSYNSNQAIYFYRTEHYPPQDGSAAHGYTGMWSSDTGAPGKGGAMVNRGITNWNNGGKQALMDWMNGANGKGYVHITSGLASDYMGMSGISIKTSYWFRASRKVFTAESDKLITYNTNKVQLRKGETPCHEMIIYPGEENLLLSEILVRREALKLNDISESQVATIEELDLAPSNGDYFIRDNTFFITMNNMKEERAAYYSYDDVDWKPLLFAPNDDMMCCPLNKYAERIAIRVINYKTDELLFHTYKDLTDGLEETQIQKNIPNQ